jgi:S-formylglutathione hydrolase FrmB
LRADLRYTWGVDISLTHGWLPIAVQVVAACVLAAAVGWRSRRWRLRWLPVAIAVGVASAAAAYWFIHFQALSDDPVPVSLWLWTAMTGLAIVVAIAGWRGESWWRRSASVVGIPLCVFCAALAVNSWTGYLPTVSSAWNRTTGAALPSQTDEAGAMDMRRRHVAPERGVLVSVKIGDDASGFRHRDELVYLPPTWFAGDTPPALPAVMMAGGEFGHPADWPDAGEARKTSDEFAASNGGNAPILVFVDTSGQFNNDTECVNGVRGNAADHLIEDVVPYVASHFGTAPEPGRWGMVGWSSGGTCALTMALLHPELFGAFVDIDGGLGPNAGSREQTIARLFGGDAAAYDAFDPTAVMAQHRPYTGLAGWFAVSTPGPTVFRAAGSGPPARSADDIDPEDHAAVADYLCGLASSDGIPCAVVPHDGGHDFGSAARVFSDALPWLASRLGTPTVPTVELPGAGPAS